LELSAFVVRYCRNGRAIQSGGLPLAASTRIQRDSNSNTTEIPGKALRLLEFSLSKLFDRDTKRLLQQVASALVIANPTGQQVPQAAAVTLDHL
jgi:hypothetical protein